MLSAMRWLLVTAITAACGCGGGDAGPAAPLAVTIKFTVSSETGHGPSPLDVLVGHAEEIHVELPAPQLAQTANQDGSCLTTVLFEAADMPVTATATGDDAALVQSMLLDRLPAWDVDLQACAGAATPAVLAINGDINELNVRFDCAGVPASATTTKDAGGYPVLSSFTATTCTSDILDVVNNRDLLSTGFSVEVATHAAHLP